MSINKRHVADLETVKRQYEENGHNAFVKTWFKTEVFMGDGEGIDFINKKLEEGFKEEIVKQ